MNLTMQRTDPHCFDRQIRDSLISAKGERAIEVNFDKNYYLKLILIQSVSFKDNIRNVIIE